MADLPEKLQRLIAPRDAEPRWFLDAALDLVAQRSEALPRDCVTARMACSSAPVGEIVLLGVLAGDCHGNLEASCRTAQVLV
jgi:hypothetical protein